LARATIENARPSMTGSPPSTSTAVVSPFGSATCGLRYCRRRDHSYVASAKQTEARVVEVRRLTAGRAYRSDALLQAIVIAEDPAVTAARLAESFTTVSAEQLLDSPFVLFARDRSHTAEIIVDRRERFGFESFMAHEPFLDELGSLIAAHRG
jgi:hypothetical protein